MTIEKLAFTAGVSVSTVNRAEAGEHDPSVKSLVRIARALGVSVGELIGEPEREAS